MKIEKCPFCKKESPRLSRQCGRCKKTLWNTDSSPIKVPKTIEFKDIGLGLVEHNLTCWICEKEPAVYSTPDHLFKPCWKDQHNLGMIKGKKWYQFWK
jgi:hypothetical protein